MSVISAAVIHVAAALPYAMCLDFTMSTLSERLTQALSHSAISQAELARRVGVRAPSVHGWFSGKARFLRGENLLAAAKALGVDEGWLATGKGEMVTPGSADRWIGTRAMDAPRPGYVRFERMPTHAAALPAAHESLPEVVESLDMAEWEVRRKLGFLPLPGQIRLITGRGPSMRPTLDDGDIAWIDTRCTAFEGDDYYLIAVGDEAQVKMLQQRADGIYVVSTNPEFPPYRAGDQAPTILGKALLHAGLRRF